MHKTNFSRVSFNQLSALKATHLAQTTAPLDGMWESFVEYGEHWLLECEGMKAGYCVLNDANQIIQFHSTHHADSIFAACIKQFNAVGAVAATCDPQFHSLAKSHQKETHINALMYEYDESVTTRPITFAKEQNFSLVSTSQHEAAVEFAETTLGAPRDWLTGYYENLINKEELWAVWQGGHIIATGECRVSSHQRGIADVGMVVGKSARGQGLATGVLQALVKLARDNGYQAICSTEVSNKAAQKAIARAGFVTRHQIVEFKF